MFLSVLRAMGAQDGELSDEPADSCGSPAERFDMLKRELEHRTWVFIGCDGSEKDSEVFKRTTQVAFRAPDRSGGALANVCSSHAVDADIRHLLEVLGVRETFERQDYVRALAGFRRNSALDPGDIRCASDLVKLLVIEYEHGMIDAEGSGDNIWLPDSTRTMRRSTTLFYNDMPWISAEHAKSIATCSHGEATYLAHDDVVRTLSSIEAKRVGLHSLLQAGRPQTDYRAPSAGVICEELERRKCHRDEACEGLTADAGLAP